MDKFKNLINGRPLEPFSKEYFKDTSPIDTQDILGLFPKSDKRDVNKAVESAWSAFNVWKEFTPPKRGELIFKVAELLKKEQVKLAKVICKEVGKTMPEALGEVESSIDIANFMAGEGRRMYGQTAFSALKKRWALTKRFPVGVCGLITAWNAPLAIVTWKLFPALICGNTVVLKPSEDAPLTAHLLGGILKEAGFPDGVVNIVYGIGPEVGSALVRHHKVGLVSFTGSSKIGRLISEECGRQMKKCSLELGGKNGAIIMDDADLKRAAEAAALGAFSAAGQRCAATSRVFVHKDVYGYFLRSLIKEAGKIEPGICPIINKRQFDSIIAYIEEAKISGAKLLYGGKVLKRGRFSKGYFIQPAIFTDVDIKARLAQEEVFGPVLSVFKINSLSDGINSINAVDYGLSASIFTSNVNSAILALENIQAGCCYVNAPTFGSEPHMPFGGIKNSGNGTREPGIQALEVFSEWKTIYIDYSAGLKK